MPLTSGEFGLSALLTTAAVGFTGWIKYIAGRCEGLGKRLETLEGAVSEKSSVLDVHSTNLCAGEKKMNEMKAELKTLNQGISELHLLGVSTVSKIDALGEKIKTGINEVFLRLDPRLESVEKQVRELEENKN